MDHRVSWGAVWLALLCGSSWGDGSSCVTVDGSHPITVCDRSVADSKFHEYSASGTLCAAIPEVVALLTNVNTIPDWFPDVLEARTLSDDTQTLIIYLKNRAPWPLRPRDMVYRFSVVSHEPDGSVSVGILGVPDFIPPVPKVVRMEGAQGGWSLDSENLHTDVTFTMHLELGDVPAFIANRRVQETVSGAVRNLQDRFACS